MFRELHRICVGFCWLAVIAVVGALYYHRSLYYPLVDLVDALRVREGLEQQKSGEIYVGTNNMNVQAVETGIVQAKRENMRGLPLKDRYALIQAERKARANTE